MRRRRNGPGAGAKPGKAAAKLRSAPPTRGQAAKPKRPLVAPRKKAPAKPRRNPRAPAETLAQLRAERDEALAQQTATAEILDIINRSSGDPAPAFDAILERAMRLCDAPFGGLLVLEGEFIRYLALHNAPERFTHFLTHNRIRPRTMLGPRWETGSIFHIADLSQSEAYGRRIPVTVSAVEDGGIRSMLLVPIMKDGAFIGAFTVYRQEARPFTDRQVALARSFADQSAIAMENARLLTALSQRTGDLQQSLEYQTATSDVLKVISGSTFDLQPVLDTLMETAARLCNADGGGLTVREGDGFRYLSTYGLSKQLSAVVRERPYRLNRGSIAGRTAIAGTVVQIGDVATDPEYVQQDVKELNEVHGALGVPMMRDEEVFGTFSLTRNRVEPFTERQIGLIRTFADQAVIAIENARLVTDLRKRTNDLQQSLEYQTATSDVLKVISRSTFDLQPVLDKLVETAGQLCGADGGIALALRDGEVYRYAAIRGVSDEFGETLRRQVVVPGQETIAGRAALEGKVVHVEDLAADPHFVMRTAVTVDRIGSVLGVPMLREGTVVGTFSLARRRVEPFTDRQIELVRTFADQAVIAIENARLLTELREALDRQTATADVLQVINSSPGDLAPVFDAILEKAHTLCGASRGALFLYDGAVFRAMAVHGYPDELALLLRRGAAAAGGAQPRPLLEGARFVHIHDLFEFDDPIARQVATRGGVRTNLLLPLRKDDKLLGMISCNRGEVRPFTEKEIALLESFAAQAVIAMDNARLLSELRESLEQQRAMAEVLGVINANPGDLQPVFDAVLEKAHALCGSGHGTLFLRDGDYFRPAAMRGVPEPIAERLRDGILGADIPLSQPLLDGERFVHLIDMARLDHPMMRLAYANGVRTLLSVPLRQGGTVLGVIVAARFEAQRFSDSQIALLESFAAQAVIAMDNARLLDEIRQRQAELRVTFDNMGDAVIMFDGEQRLVAWNCNFLNMVDIPEEWLKTPQTYTSLVHYFTERGEFGDTAPPDVGGPDRDGDVRPIRYERTRPDSRVLEVRRNPIPGGAGFVFIYSDITERKLAERSILAAREAAERALADLKLAQGNLIQAEKMASLGALTAGIAHEIKNPLNFVNNFASLSNDLLGELKETAAPAFATLDAAKRGEIDEAMEMLSGNLEKIQEHGRRADGIVKSMLAHSRGGSGDRREADVNALVEESLNLAFHGARAQDQNFNITLERDYDQAVKPIELVPQDLTRVFLNLCGNGFYAANKRRREGGDAGFRPVLRVATRELGDAVEVRVRDNGTGIPPELKDKLFQPFFTTKPTGEGTGLGLSISYDIVTQQHGGTIAVESRVDDFTEFTIRLPRKR